jgi:uroporphyrinogen-III synthase
MAILVTRPQPDNEATASALRARGYEVLLAPMLRFEAVPPGDDLDARYDAVIVSSANALRAVDLAGHALLASPVYAVGEHTAEAARAAGFRKVLSAAGDACGLRDLLRARVKAKELKKRARLIYLAGADLSRDLAGKLGADGFDVVTRTTYRMVALATLPRDALDAFAANGIEAVLHYSARSARAFVEAVRGAGIEISALSVLQCCLSGNVAAILREAGATSVQVAATPDEKALFEALVERALRSGLA